MTPTAIQTRLQELGKLADDAAPLCETLILLGALDRENVELAPYYDHITTLHQALEHEIEQHLPAQENAHWQLERLNTVLLQQFGYHKDQSSFDDPNQINFLNVIDQRAGLPVAISALYLELAQRRGWQAAGLQFPGHFLIRLEQDGERVIADPFHGGQEMNAGSLRHLLKTTVGPQAELSHTYYDTVSNREVILRFCNNRKTRFIEQTNYEAAMQVVTRELWLAPNEPRLYFDAGVIIAKLEQIGQAIAYLQKFIEISKDTATVAQAQTMLNVFRRNLQ